MNFFDFFYSTKNIVLINQNSKWKNIEHLNSIFISKINDKNKFIIFSL